MYPLKCKVQHYPWGQPGCRSTVATLSRDKDIDPEKPFAELWIGTHNKAPSIIESKSKEIDPEYPLGTLLASNPAEYLGRPVLQQWPKLTKSPFLLKVLSINKTLSLQAHPDLKLAKELHQHDSINYPDPNHKPEMAIALTPFEAMIGFRPLKDILHFFNLFPTLKRFVDDYEHAIQSPEPVVLKTLFSSVFTASNDTFRPILETFIYHINQMSQSGQESVYSDPLYDDLEILPPLSLVLRLNKQFPQDVGNFAPIFLNCIKFKVGQAAFLGACQVHAYLSGDIIECMAASDNVVRAGCTPKFKDTSTLIQMLKYSSGFSRVFPQINRRNNHTILTYSPPSDIPDFLVEKHIVQPKSHSFVDSRGSLQLLCVVDGEGQFSPFDSPPTNTVEFSLPSKGPLHQIVQRFQDPNDQLFNPNYKDSLIYHYLSGQISFLPTPINIQKFISLIHEKKLVWEKLRQSEANHLAKHNDPIINSLLNQRYSDVKSKSKSQTPSRSASPTAENPLLFKSANVVLPISATLPQKKIVLDQKSKSILAQAQIEQILNNFQSMDQLAVPLDTDNKNDDFLLPLSKSLGDFANHHINSNESCKLPPSEEYSSLVEQFTSATNIFLQKDPLGNSANLSSPMSQQSPKSVSVSVSPRTSHPSSHFVSQNSSLTDHTSNLYSSRTTPSNVLFQNKSTPIPPTLSVPPQNSAYIPPLMVPTTEYFQPSPSSQPPQIHSTLVSRLPSPRIQKNAQTFVLNNILYTCHFFVENNGETFCKISSQCIDQNDFVNESDNTLIDDIEFDDIQGSTSLSIDQSRNTTRIPESRVSKNAVVWDFDDNDESVCLQDPSKTLPTTDILSKKQIMDYMKAITDFHPNQRTFKETLIARFGEEKSALILSKLENPPQKKSNRWAFHSLAEIQDFSKSSKSSTLDSELGHIFSKINHSINLIESNSLVATSSHLEKIAGLSNDILLPPPQVVFKSYLQSQLKKSKVFGDLPLGKYIHSLSQAEQFSLHISETNSNHVTPLEQSFPHSVPSSSKPVDTKSKPASPSSSSKAYQCVTGSTYYIKPKTRFTVFNPDISKPLVFYIARPQISDPVLKKYSLSQEMKNFLNSYESSQDDALEHMYPNIACPQDDLGTINPQFLKMHFQSPIFSVAQLDEIGEISNELLNFSLETPKPLASENKVLETPKPPPLPNLKR